MAGGGDNPMSGCPGRPEKGNKASKGEGKGELDMKPPKLGG